jgi:hypothetical protein
MPFEGDAPMLKGMMMLTVAGVAAPNLFQLVPVKASCAPTSTLFERMRLQRRDHAVDSAHCGCSDPSECQRAN